jgi:hypothetical protein
LCLTRGHQFSGSKNERANEGSDRDRCVQYKVLY